MALIEFLVKNTRAWAVACRRADLALRRAKGFVLCRCTKEFGGQIGLSRPNSVLRTPALTLPTTSQYSVNIVTLRVSWSEALALFSEKISKG